jgi:hypothetical protein
VLYRAALTFPPAGQTNQMDYLDRLRGPFGLAGLPSRAFRPGWEGPDLPGIPWGVALGVRLVRWPWPGRDTGPAARSGPRIGLEF